MQRGPRKEIIDPEELLRRKFRAKCLFRRIGRLCMENAFWLIEGIDEYQGVDDVQRRVEQAVRGRAKKQLLSIKDKALLNKPAEDRTDHEKKYLNRIIGGLKCFKRYPNHVKRKLAAMTYFKYYGPHRVVVRQHQPAHGMYFIVSGEVVVSQMIYDELLEQYVSVDIGKMTAGDMFGEISLLHNIPRTATVTTTDHCEFLMLKEEDFKYVLLTSVQKQWDEVKLAMSMFSYFDALDAVSFREGCIVAKMKNFEENETILGDGIGVPNHVYFILSGRVQMIEAIQVHVTKRLGKKFYTLFDPYETPEPSEEDFEKKWFAAYNKKESASAADLPRRKTLNSGMQTRSGMAQSILKRSRSKMLSNVQVGSKTSKDGVEETNTSQTEAVGETKTSKTEGMEETKTSKSEVKEGVETAEQAVGPDVPMGSKRTSFSPEGVPETVETEPPELAKEKSDQKQLSTQTIDRRHSLSSPQPSLLGSKILLAPAAEEGAEVGRPSVRYSVLPGAEQRQAIKDTRTLKTFFMQVCIMNPGSTFGFGENMRDRRIIALTPVHCMLMPKMWLLQRNTANIWTRIQYYLSKKIPNKQKLFEEFTKQIVWQDYKKQCVEDVVINSKTVNNTTLHDVPYSIRLEEMFGC